MKKPYTTLCIAIGTCTFVACSSSEAPPPVAVGADPDAGYSTAAAPDASPTAEEAADASPPRAPGPSFTVPPEALAIESDAAPGGQSSAYESKADSTALESGKPSTLLASTDGATSKTFAATTGTHAIDDATRGRRYRMRAKFKTDQATAGWLWWRIDGPGFWDIDNMGYPVDRRITGTSDWQEVSLVMDVSKLATGFAFGSGLTGKGKVWVGAITFEDVGPDVPTTPHFGSE